MTANNRSRFAEAIAIARPGTRKRVASAPVPAPDDEPLHHPKPGPDQVLIEEFIGAATGHAKRYRNIGVTPLDLAYTRGKLHSPRSKTSAEDRREAGNQFARWFTILHAGGRDSTQRSIRASEGLFLTEAREDAGRKMASAKAKMGKANFCIVEAFVGFGHSMADSLRKAEIDCHPDGTAHRIREALDDLVDALGLTQSRAPSRIRAETIHPFQADET